MTKNSSHPPEHYAEIRDRQKMAGVKDKRFKILEADVAQVNEFMDPFVRKAREAVRAVNEEFRAAETRRTKR